MRIVFMGTPDFAVPALAALAEGGHTIAAVVTQPDKQKGRGKAVQMTPVKAWAVEHGIPVYQPVKVREPEFVQILRELAPQVIVVAAFGQILTKEILELPPFGCVNIHASLLPKYRGAAPIQWAIICGETETGITTMQMNEGLDTGDMLERAVIPIAPDETGGSLHDKLSQAGGPLILSTLKKREEGSIRPVPQGESGTCYARMLTKSLGDIDWTMPAEEIERLIRGLNPWPSAYTSWNGRTIKIWSAEVLPEQAADAPDGAVSALGAAPEAELCPGQIVRADKACLAVCTGKGILQIKELQLEGKKRMDAAAFLRGCPIKAGDVWEHRQSGL